MESDFIQQPAEHDTVMTGHRNYQRSRAKIGRPPRKSYITTVYIVQNRVYTTADEWRGGMSHGPLVYRHVIIQRFMHDHAQQLQQLLHASQPG